MSSAVGEVIHKQHLATMGFFRYDGTADVVVPRVYLRRGDLSRFWRNEKDKEPWPCNHNLQEIWVYSSYGSGFYWAGQWCPTCRMIAPDSTMPWEHTDEFPVLDGRP